MRSFRCLLSVSLSVLLLLLSCFCIVPVSSSSSAEAASAQEAVRQMESLAQRATAMAQSSPRNKQSLIQALQLCEQAISLFEGNSSKHIDDALQSTALFVYDTTSTLYVQVANQYLRDPSKGQAVSRAEYCGSSAMTIVQTQGFGVDAQSHFHTQLAKTKTLLKKDCAAAEHLQFLLDQANNDLSQLKEDIRFLTVSSIGSCNPQAAIPLWDQMLKLDYLSATQPQRCKTCWAFVMVAHERNKAGSAQAKFDQLQLADHTPYKHALQVPGQINTALLTDEPEPYQDPKESSVCQALQANKDTIMNEYATYQQKVKAGKLTNMHETYHQDVTLSEQSGGGWDGLFLRRGEGLDPDAAGNNRDSGWQAHACKEHFPKTCAVLQSVPQVNGLLAHKGGPTSEQQKNCGNHNNDGYGSWCRGNEDQSAGVVAFYSLQPGTELRLHTGPTNQRLKCHLVISTPKDGSAWMEVGGIRKQQATGDIIAFDDSYLHRVGNDHPSEVRVILDVTAYHPDLALYQPSSKNGGGGDSKSSKSGEL